jgi:hypothetical protein
VKTLKLFPIVWKSAWNLSKKPYLFGTKITERKPFDVKHSNAAGNIYEIYRGGFHTFASGDMDAYTDFLGSKFGNSWFWEFRTCLCTIPAGTEYYTGILGDIVSKSIIVHKPKE